MVLCRKGMASLLLGDCLRDSEKASAPFVVVVQEVQPCKLTK